MTQKSQSKSDSTADVSGGEVEKKLRPTWSQPLLSRAAAGSQENTLVVNRAGRLSESGSMYRPDVFYQGSLTNIPRYRSRGELSITNEDRSAWSKPIVLEEDEVR